MTDYIGPVIVERKHSGLGIASFATALASGALQFISVIIAGLLTINSPTEEMDDASASVLGCSMLILMLISLVALGLGIAGLLQRDTKKVFSVLGVVFAVVPVLCMLGLMVIGLTMA